MNNTRYLQATLAFIVAAMPFVAQADVIYQLAGYECRTEEDTLLITYDVAYNQKIPQRIDTQWAPWALVDIEEKDDRAMIVNLRSAGGVCELSDGAYKITIHPNPGNANIMGRNGACMGATAEVVKDQQTFYTLADCEYSDDLIRRVTLRPGQTPEIERPTWDELIERTKADYQLEEPEE
jgi:hypothetical protein